MQTATPTKQVLGAAGTHRQRRRGRLPANPVLRGEGHRALRPALGLLVCTRQVVGAAHTAGRCAFGDTWKPRWVPSLHVIPAGMLQKQQQRKKNTHPQKMYVPRYRTTVTKANAAFPRGYSRKTSSTDSVLQNRSVPHAPSFCSQPSSSHRSAPCPLWATTGCHFWPLIKHFLTPQKSTEVSHTGMKAPDTWAGGRRLMPETEGAISEPSTPGLCSHRPDSDSSFSSKVQVHLQEASNLGLEVPGDPPNSFPRSSSGSQGVSSKDPALRRHFCH